MILCEDCTSLNTLQILLMLDGGILWYMNHISIKLFKKKLVNRQNYTQCSSKKIIEDDEEAF